MLYTRRDARTFDRYSTPIDSVGHSRTVSVRTASVKDTRGSVSMSDTRTDIAHDNGGVHDAWKNQFSSAISSMLDLMYKNIVSN